MIEKTAKLEYQKRIRELEDDLLLKTLQLENLLSITSAINNNMSANALFTMLESFICDEMGIDKMALFLPKDHGQWECATSNGVNSDLQDRKLINSFLIYSSSHEINKNDPKPLRHFKMVIPVFHKDTPISYLLIGKLGETSEDKGKLRFITLLTHIVSVALENKRLFKRQIRQTGYTRELELASKVQKMLIPDTLTNKPGFELASIYKPHFEVGGDYFDCFEFDERHFAFCIADISGKGVSAAMLMANFQAILQSFIHSYNDISQLIQELNKAVFNITQGDRFITFFIAMIDLESKEIFFVNAGHMPPLASIDGEKMELSEGCTILGAFEQLDDIDIGFRQYDKEALILAYTDGLNDLRNNDGTYFDEIRVREFLDKYEDLPTTKFTEKLQSEMEVFREDQEYADDIAIIACRLSEIEQ